MLDVRRRREPVARDHGARARRVGRIADTALVQDFLAGNLEGYVRGGLAVPRLPPFDDLVCPFHVLRQREVRVGFVHEGRRVALGGIDGRLAPVLGTARPERSAFDGSERIEELPFQPAPFGVAGNELEGVAQEVVGAGVLVEPANEIADRIDEVLLARRRCVEHEVLGEFEQRAAHVVRHAFQHFELQPVETVVVGREDERIRQFEQIVRRDAEGDRRDVVGLERLVNHAPEVGVRRELVLVGCLGPAAGRGLDALGFHVGAFDDADRDAFAARGDAPARPLVDTLLPDEGIGHVGLQRNAAARLLETRPVERAHEGLRGDRQIRVLLHVEIDELRNLAAVGVPEAHARRLAVEQLQPVAQDRERVLERQRGKL